MENRTAKLKVDSECNSCTDWKDWVLVDKEKSLWARCCKCLLITQFTISREDLTQIQPKELSFEENDLEEK